MASSSGTRKRKYISARESVQEIQDFLDSLDTEPYLDHNFIGENDDIDDVQDHDDDIQGTSNEEADNDPNLGRDAEPDVLTDPDERRA